MKHIPRKRFGQHFLTDRGVIDEIIHAIAPRPGDHLVEIGPGLGALSQPLLERSGGVTVIELDRDLVAHWRSREGVTVIDSDVLKVPLTRIQAALNARQQKAKDTAPTIRLVGNLPYNISTPILFHFLPMAQQIVDQHFMLQLEVVERMVAEPATSAYGRLSVMLQWRYEMDNFLRVPPEAFDPAPRVHSAVVRMKPRAKPEPLKPEWLEQLVQVAFSQRRKLLRHTLGRWLDVHQFSGDFDLHRRAEEVPVDEYVALAQHMTQTAHATGP